MKVISKSWDLLAAIILATVCFVWVAASSWAKISTELITFFGIIAAAILPVMIFSAGLLRPQGVTLNDVRRYRVALEKQMIFWVTLLVLTFSTVALVIAGKAFDWDLPTVMLPYIAVAINFSSLLSGAIGFFVTLTCLRTIPMIKGIISLSKLNSQMVEDAIKRDNVNAVAHAVDEVAAMAPLQKPSGYGRIVKPAGRRSRKPAKGIDHAE